MALDQLRLLALGSLLVSDSLSGYLCLDASLARASEQMARKQDLRGTMIMGVEWGLVMKTETVTGSIHPEHLSRVMPDISPGSM